ncbi:MAG TPA: Tex family protein [Bacteroidales bacterium]|nr:Tex family protein [Bacteroidales bacterium]HNY59349.1 Tex family protein [Bacteroidales bacterium]HOG66421.1 Tex family protein [Bacteroidales bacterium]HPW43053.1 Tex family protein [Bacteroidales bacterium]
MEDQIKIIATGLGIKPKQVTSVLLLLEQGATIPFVARYRKELTEELNEEEITAIRDGYEKLTEITKRRESIINTLKETGQLTDDLELQLNNAVTLSELEDIYLPYRPKRKTRASVARDRGLEPLAKLLMRQQYDDVEKTARKYVNFEKEITTVEHALEGARDIIAEWVSENKVARERLRTLYRKRATIKSEVVKAKIEMAQNFSNYFDFEEPLDRSPSHRILAMLRGENEGFLRLQIAPPPNLALQILEKIFVKNESSAAQHVLLAVQDSYKRLLQPALENEFRADAKERADKEAIRIFVDNVRQLLMAPPLGQKRVLAIDPGFKTGCKIVCLDEQGKLLHNETIYPHPPQNEVRQSITKIEQLVDAYKIDAIAIGNGTGGRETERLVRHLRFNREVIAVMVNESGASVYSASSVAREEFPDYDVTVRGAVSIGRRLIDPLAELVKIDPKSIGVGQYQHDVNQTQLARSLDDTVMSCVNAVGVEVNTASKQLLAYVSGIGPSLAQNIVSFRNQNGAFDSRQALNKVPRFGPKSFEQAAGFLRVNTSANPLDKTAVHPESYHIVEKMAKSLGVTVEELMKNADLQSKINIEEFVTDQAGIPTLKDIVEELARPGRDPREKFGVFQFSMGINTIKDLKEGMILPGIVTNITAFGAFVDVGVHQDGLVHKSKITDRYVNDPSEFFKVNQRVKVKVENVDLERKRIQLTMIGVEQPKYVF